MISYFLTLPLQLRTRGLSLRQLLFLIVLEQFLEAHNVQAAVLSSCWLALLSCCTPRIHQRHHHP
jgi:hypothetical protein